MHGIVFNMMNIVIDIIGQFQHMGNFCLTPASGETLQYTDDTFLLAKRTCCLSGPARLHFKLARVVRDKAQGT